MAMEKPVRNETKQQLIERSLIDLDEAIRSLSLFADGIYGEGGSLAQPNNLKEPAGPCLAQFLTELPQALENMRERIINAQMRIQEAII